MWDIKKIRRRIIKKNGRKKALFFQCRPSEPDPSSVVDQFLQAFVGLADSVMVSSVGEAAVSGVSLYRYRHGAGYQYLYGACHRRSSHYRPIPGKQRSEMPVRPQTSCWLLP